jgi:hypothetical protein
MPPPGQARRQLSSSPNISFHSSDFRDLVPGANVVAQDNPVVSPSFVEAVAHSMGFRMADEDYRINLHSIPKVPY